MLFRSDNDDIDALLADLDTGTEAETFASPDKEIELAADIDLDALLSEDQSNRDNSNDLIESEQLSGSETSLAEADVETTEPELSSESALEPKPESESTSVEEDDIDSLLSDLQGSGLDEAPISDEQPEFDVAETDSAADSQTKPEDELDFLLDSLSSESQAQDEQSQQQTDSDDLALELDSLLADFDADETSSEDNPESTDSTDDLSEWSLVDDDVEPEVNLVADEPVTKPTLVNDDAAAQELEDLLADMTWDQPQDDIKQPEASTQLNETSADQGTADESKVERSSKQPDYDTSSLAIDPIDEDVTDEDLLAAFSESLGEDDNDGLSSEDEFFLNDNQPSVDDASSSTEKSSHQDLSLARLEAGLDTDVSNKPLSTFERENGFIDIDKLLNDADEESENIDLYKDVDVDVGEVDSLIGNADMVDVDDEENSVNAKLDLARAYLEIEDQDSAVALLKEVQIDGNERQQSEAQSLLKNIS